MIDVTVKTLDSQNHRYSVPDDITVKQFKDRIASSVNIPPDKQRLIYCGRVLQDEKSLSEYNVHEKVIHLVMRAPPPPLSRSGDRRANGTTGDSNGASASNSGPGAHFRQRVRANQGPSSSGVRLQQAKSMLDKAAIVIGRLEAADVLPRLEAAAAAVAAGQGTGQDSSSPNDQPSTSRSANEPMETSFPSNSEEPTAVRPSTSRPEGEEAEGAVGQRQDDQASPSQELEALYNEMDALNSMDPPMIEGGHLMTSAIGNPIMGAISNSLQGGLFQAASAAFVSALSSMGATPAGTSAPSPPSVSTTASSPSTSSTFTTTSVTAPPLQPATSTPSTSSSSSSSQSSSSSGGGGSEQQATPRPTEGSQASGNHPLSGVRGITVRITNRGSPRASGIRLEHPRCSVMVEVLDQYQDVERRLQPFLQQYYRNMVEDRSYEEDSRQLRKDQLVLWRVSSAMHYISHAMHAISDIMVDLRRDPPRQLRARPFIIPQPALVQAQINVGPSSDGPHGGRVLGRNADPNSSSDSLNAENVNSSETTAAPAGSNISSSSSSNTNQPTVPPPRAFLNMPDYLDDENGVVFMHVGPNGITIDSLSAEGSGTDAGPTPPPELIQNIMSSITSQLGMRLGGASASTPSTSSGSNSSPPSTPGVRRVPPVHNSQATGNSGTSTTNATQTRVTPRAQQVHVTPLHVPGMGMTQFDPFLPCQSHHIRFEAARRRRRATVPTSQSNQSNSQDNEETLTRPSSIPQQTSSAAQNTSTQNAASATHLSLFTNLLAEIMSGRNNEQQSEEEQQQEQMFAQLVRGVMSEVSGSIGAQSQGSSRGGSQQQQTSLQEFLEPFSGGNFFAEGERDSIFAHLFNTVSQALSMGDLIQLFFGDSARLNQLFNPLQQFVRERVLRGVAPSETNMDRAIDEIISDLDPHLIASAGNAAIQDGIDYVNTIHNFIRHRLHDLFNLILNHSEQNTFGAVLVALLRHTLGEFVALSLHCFTDGAQGLERLVEGRVQSIMSGMSPSIQAWSVNTSIMQLRSMMGHLAITDDHIRRYVVSPDEGRRMGEERQNRLSPVSPVPLPRPTEGTSTQNNIPEREQANGSTENCVEVMEVDELGSVEEISTSESGSGGGGGSVGNEEAPLSVTVGSQSWHSAVPQDWIPVITRDVERQRRGVPDTNLSDGYLCGVPLKRRKIAAQRKPHGTVQQVFQDTLRQSLRTSGVNRTLVESVSNEVSCELENSFATHVRCALREELENNEEFKPEKFPKSEQKIRKKFQ